MDGRRTMPAQRKGDQTNANAGPGPATRLGRAVRATADGAAAVTGGHREGHPRTNWLRDVILGGQDGLVNILGIILGVIAAGGSDNVLLVTGLAAAITESISMAAVGSTSSTSERDFYRSEEAREAAEIATTPDAEAREIRDIYAAKGFTGALLESVVDTITANRDTWLATMMDEELHIQPVDVTLGRHHRCLRSRPQITGPVNRGDVRRRDLLGGLIHEYHGLAA
jgi:VIT family